MENRTMGLHETLEIHELMTFKNLCLTKSATMSALIQDQELKDILDQDVTKTKQELQRLKSFVT